MIDNVEWNKIKNAKELIDFLIDFLHKVFKKEYIMDQYKKLKSLAPRSKPEELKYLIEPNIHIVALVHAMLGQHDKALAIDPKYRPALKLKEKLDKAKDIEEIG